MSVKQCGSVAEKRIAGRVAGRKPSRRRAERPASVPDLLLWEQRFEELKAFKKQHGHCKVPTTYQPNPALGHWVSRIRLRKKRGELDGI